MRKRIFAALLVILTLFVFASCFAGGESTGGGSNSESGFDPDDVTFASAYSEAQMLGFSGTLDEFIELISGKDGAPGRPGADGVTPTVEISGDGYWVINGEKTDVKAVGEDGEDGEDGKTPTFKIENGNLYVSYDYGASWSDIGHIQGADGDDGKDGADGAPGQNGADGAPGADGEDGKDGVDGTNGKSAYELYKEKFGYEGTEEQWLSDLINGKLVTDYHEHTFGEWVNYAGNASVYCESRLFYRICTECKIIEWKSGSYDNHDFEVVTTAPTCQAGGYDTKTCNICGKVEIVNETPTADHSWESEYSHDNSFHWYKCEHCDETNEYAEHTTDESGYCTVCEAPIGSTFGVIYEVSADATYAEVIGYTGTAKNIIIADTYESLPVTKIYREAFKKSTIKSVVIPDSVTSIGGDAFRDCDSLTSVVIGDSVTSIGGDAFYGCYNLTSVVIPDSVTSIGEYAFYSCSSLTSVVIPDSVTSIGGDAFYGCDSLTSVTIKGAPVIASGAFSYCNSALYSEYELGKYVGDAENPYAILVELTNRNLSTYTIHEDTRFIGNRVFQNCERLTNITIPDSITSIGNSAFCSCDSLTSVVIGDSITSIGGCAFYSCDSLTSVKYRGTEEQWNAITKGSNWNHGTGNYTITFNYDGE